MKKRGFKALATSGRLSLLVAATVARASSRT